MARIVEKLASALRGLRRRMLDANQATEQSGVKGADWYNQAFAEVDAYRRHYTESSYYFLWTVLVDRILRAHVKNILDLGCGPGQFASLLYDKKIRGYRGADFSSTCIEMARMRCPSYDFITVDLTQSDILETSSYDCIVTLEFLEHVEFDLEVISRIRPGTKFFATVPNFPYESHVRHFAGEFEVIQRYEKFFADFTVDAFLENPQGKTFYLMEGIRSKRQQDDRADGM